MFASSLFTEIWPDILLATKKKRIIKYITNMILFSYKIFITFYQTQDCFLLNKSFQSKLSTNEHNILNVQTIVALPFEFHISHSSSLQCNPYCTLKSKLNSLYTSEVV